MTFGHKLQYHPQWNLRAYTYTPFFLYGSAVLFVLLAFLLQFVIVQFSGSQLTFLIFFAAIVGSSWIGGYRAGLLATLLSAALAYVFFTAPYTKIVLKSPGSIFSAYIFILEGIFISFLSQNMHTAIKNSELKNGELKKSEERYR